MNSLIKKGKGIMKRTVRRIVGLGSGASVGIVFIVLTFVLILGINSGTMTNLYGEELLDIVEVTPHAGDGILPSEGQEDACGSYIEMIGHPVSESKFRKTGKKYRILPPNSMMTYDYNPKRINVHVDETGIIEDVVCG